MGVRLVAELHQQGARDLPGRLLVLLGELRTPAPNLPLPKGIAHPEDVFLHRAHHPLVGLEADVSCDLLDGAPLGLGAPPAPRAHQVLELDHYGVVIILPPQKLPVALIEGLEPASPELSA